jgi:Aerotolerance regulator N-terminal/von Willebrand factor type A domain
MSFLHPWAVGLAALASLPVLLHILRRDTRRRLAFPAIRYLQRARERSARAIELRDRLLLATRSALILTLAAAASGPLFGRGDVSDHFPTDLVLLIDNSGSMSRLAGGITLLDVQRERALELVASARSGDRFWVLPCVGPALAVGVPAEAAARAVELVGPTDAAADLSAGVREALRLLPAGTTRAREIVVLSDFQDAALQGKPVDLPDDVRIVASRVDADSANAALLDLTVEPPRPGHDGAASARVASFGPMTSDTVEARLVVDGETVSIARAGIGGSVVLRLPDPGAGQHAISVVIPPSGARFDDRRPFVLRVLETPSVWHSGPPGSYVSRALETLASDGGLDLRSTPGTATAWFVEGQVEGSAQVASDGAGPLWILTPPADDELLARFNSTLDRLAIPWTVTLVDTPGRLEIASSPAVPGLESIRLQGRHRLTSAGAGADTVFLRASDGSPWVVGGRASGRKYLLIGAPLVPEATDLPVSAEMLPFMETVLFDWAGLGGELPEPVTAGTAALLPADADSVSTPEGKTLRVDGGSPYVPLRVGMHEIFRRGGGTSLLAATAPASESDLGTAAPGRLAGSDGSARVVVASTGRQWRAAMYGSRRGRPLAPYLVALAVFLVVAEAVIAAPRRGTMVARHHHSAGGRS